MLHKRGQNYMAESPEGSGIRRRSAPAQDAERPARRLSHFTPPDDAEALVSPTPLSPVVGAIHIPSWSQLVAQTLELKRVQDASLDAYPPASPPASPRDDEARSGVFSPRPKLRPGKLHCQRIRGEVKKEATANRARKTFLRMLAGSSAGEAGASDGEAGASDGEAGASDGEAEKSDGEVDEETSPVQRTSPAERGANRPAPWSKQRGSRERFDDVTINRISLRLDGFESYSVLGALVLGFALNNLTAVTSEEFNGVPWLVTFVFVVLSVITSFASMYTLMVFALCSLYGKTSLGIKNDQGYSTFIVQTAPFRELAFITFMVSLIGTCVSVL